MTKYCSDCEKQVETYWELWSCDKNPEGLSDGLKNHGNIIGDMSTCEDDYCKPTDGEVELQTDPKEKEEYIRTHEVNERCSECHQMMECMMGEPIGVKNVQS